jgi:hypothetical protein
VWADPFSSSSFTESFVKILPSSGDKRGYYSESSWYIIHSSNNLDTDITIRVIAVIIDWGMDSSLYHIIDVQQWTRNVIFFFWTGEPFLLISMNSVIEIPWSPVIKPGVARQGLWLLALTTSSCRSRNVIYKESPIQ